MGSKEEPMVAYYEEKNRGMHPRVCMNYWILPMCRRISENMLQIIRYMYWIYAIHWMNGCCNFCFAPVTEEKEQRRGDSCG